MKKTIITLALILIYQLAYSQSETECRKIVSLTIESINQSSSESLNQHLAPDFTFAGQEGELAKIVLNQLLSQLGETIKSNVEKSSKQEDDLLELKYNIEYEKMETREATFVFNDQNLLKELNLFTLEVKMMSGPSEVLPGESDVFKIPFKMAGNLIAVDVQLDGEKRNFILDTGTSKVILNSKYIKSDKPAKKSISSVKGVGGNISGMDIQKLKSLVFGEIKMDHQKVLTLDLSHLEEELGQTIYGLIGYELIKDYDIIFDYKEQMITLLNPKVYEGYKLKNFANNTLTTLPFELEGHIPIVEIQIDSKTYNLGIDCGAELNLMDDDLYPILLQSLSNITTDELRGADNNSKKVNQGDINHLQVGGKVFNKTTTLFSDISHLNDAYKINIDGLIGFPILSKQRTLLSFKRKELTFIE